jgi:hypothetical protein
MNTNQKGGLYLVSHNGLGDNLFMIGALRFLLQFYDTIYFLCKQKYLSNVELFFLDTKNIICVPFDENMEKVHIKQIINENYGTNDILICGDCHKSYLQSKITNQHFLQYIPIVSTYKIDYDSLTSENYKFIENFYRDARLNLTHYFDSFYLPSTQESMELYNTVKTYHIIFIQLISSNGKRLNVSNLLDKHLHNENTILICNDVNLYDIENKTADIEEKYKICQRFVNNRIVYYKDTIQHSNEIYMIDSCFIGIVLPYLKTGKLIATTVRIILRDNADKIII